MKELGGGENSAPQTPHLLFLDTGKRGKRGCQPDKRASAESAGGADFHAGWKRASVPRGNREDCHE